MTAILGAHGLKNWVADWPLRKAREEWTMAVSRSSLKTRKKNWASCAEWKKSSKTKSKNDSCFRVSVVVDRFGFRNAPISRYCSLTARANHSSCCCSTSVASLVTISGSTLALFRGYKSIQVRERGKLEANWMHSES